MNNLESVHQQNIFIWATLHKVKYPELELLHAIPNGGKRDIRTASRLKKEGAMAGVSDIHLPVPNKKYHSLYIELKVGKNKPTEKQVWFIEKTRAYGNYSCVAYGWQQATDIIKRYLNNDL